MATKTKDVRLSDKMLSYVAFASFAQEHGIRPGDLGELLTLANRRFAAAERECNTGSERDERAEERARERFEEKAKALGFDVQWPGLWPSLRKDGREVYLPGNIG